jgi:hypothetical protein
MQLLSRLDPILEKLKELEANGNEKASKALKSIEASLKPQKNEINK